MTITRIEPNSPHHLLVNAVNLLKLTGFGKDVASIINFTIGHFRTKDYQSFPKNWFSDDNIHKKVSLALHLFPSEALSDLDNIESEMKKSVGGVGTWMETDGRIMHFDAKNRLFCMFAYPTSGGKKPRGSIDIFSIGNPEVEPFRSVLSVPISYIINQQKNINRQYVIYLHSLSGIKIGGLNINGNDTLHYIGLTKQGWKKRFSQHLSNARSGSPLLFHKALRDYYVGSTIMAHRVINISETEKDAMDSEEIFVQGGEKQDFNNSDAFFGMDNWVFGTLYPKGLNMIPGGYAGIRVLHKMGALRNKQPIDIDQRDSILITRLRREVRKGWSNPLLAAHWNDEDYATKIICGPEGRLQPNQIIEARTLNLLGREPSEIQNIVGAKNELQIRNLLSGRTYSRIKKPH